MQHLEVLTWAICKANDGGGPGKCEPDHCACGGEARAIMKVLEADGYKIVKFTSVAAQPFVYED